MYCLAATTAATQQHGRQPSSFRGITRRERLREDYFSVLGLMTSEPQSGVVSRISPLRVISREGSVLHIRLVRTLGWTIGSATMGVPEKIRRAFVEDEVSAFFTSFSWLLQAGGEGGGTGGRCTAGT